jgi:hypothetical protein
VTIQPEGGFRSWTSAEVDAIADVLESIVQCDRRAFDEAYLKYGMDASQVARAPAIVICSALVPLAYRRLFKRRMSTTDREEILSKIGGARYPFRDLFKHGFRYEAAERG